MRLLNVTSLRLKEFYDSNIPVYAILSHRWEDEEVTFQDLAGGSGPQKRGWAKVEGCCRQAASDNFQWVWIDSCCIDKTSSSELSEAINSMFRWYRNAKVCYAYLSDVPTLSSTDWTGYSPFRDSIWFTRGWTLQELLAPRQVVFYNQNWADIGTKGSLEKHIETSTGIQNIWDFEQASVAQKMSWASVRTTTREEDMAYCLMGIFGVNMPALYGEGRNAFLRLQLEILNQSDDESIFAWVWGTEVGGGLLAPSPAAFKGSGKVEKMVFDENRAPYSMTNKGLRLELSIIAKYAAPGKVPVDFLAPLNCARPASGIQTTYAQKSQYPLAICLKHIGRDQFPEESRGGFSITERFVIKNDEVYLKDYMEKGMIHLDELFMPVGGALFSRGKFDVFLMIVDLYGGFPGLHIRTLSPMNRGTRCRINVWPNPAADFRLREGPDLTGNDDSEMDLRFGFDNRPLHNIIDITRRPNSTRRLDRLSVPLLVSGQSASAELKPRGTTPGDYIVEVTVELEGNLRWPVGIVPSDPPSAEVGEDEISDSEVETTEEMAETRPGYVDSQPSNTTKFMADEDEEMTS